MRLLHTSDWHLGRSLHRADLLDAQAAFVDHLVEVVHADRIDVVLVSGDVYDRALPPCHCLFQFYVANGKLSCQLYQRSGDVFLGVPFNIASYALLTMMVAQVTGLKPGDFVHSLGDAHLYSNHLEQARLQLTRPTRQLPVMKINPDVKDIFAFRYEDFLLEGYDPHPHIKAEVAV